MKHIIANPHNGTPVQHDELTLEPGHEVVVNERDAQDMKARHAFLLHRVADKTTLKHRVPAPLKTVLRWEQANHGSDEVPEPDSVHHVVTDEPAPKPARNVKSSKKSAKPRKRKAAK